MSDETTPGESERPSIEQVQEMLRSSGLRSTAPRVAVLRHLHAAGGPQSHGEIADALAPQGLDRTTVYRNLTALTDKGLVLRRDLGDHVWRFELASPGDELHGDHPHFVCDRCGDVRCLAEAHVTISGPLDKNIEGSQIQEIVLKGTCGRCLTTEPAASGA